MSSSGSLPGMASVGGGSGGIGGVGVGGKLPTGWPRAAPRSAATTLWGSAVVVAEAEAVS